MLFQTVYLLCVKISKGLEFSGGRGDPDDFGGYEVIIPLGLGAFFLPILYYFFIKEMIWKWVFKRRFKPKEKKTLEFLSQFEGNVWTELALLEAAGAKYFEIIQALSNQDLETLKNLLNTEAYKSRQELLKEIISQTGEEAFECQIKEIMIVDFYAPNKHLPEPECYQHAEFIAAIEGMIEIGSPRRTRKQRKRQLWRFAWEEDNWVLKKVHAEAQCTIFKLEFN